MRKFIGNKNIITNIYRIQAYDSIIWGYLCIGFIDFMLKGESLLEYTKFFPPNEYKQNDKIIKIILFVNRFLKRLRCEKSILLTVKIIKNLKDLKHHIFAIKHYFFLVFVTSVEVKMNKYLWKKNQLKH